MGAGAAAANEVNDVDGSRVASRKHSANMYFIRLNSFIVLIIYR